MRICIGVALALLWSLALGAEEALETPPDAPPRMANGRLLEGTVAQALPEGLVMQTPRGSVTYPWKYLAPGTRNRFELPMLAELKAKAEAEAKAAAAQAAREKKAAEAKAASAKKAAAAKAAKAKQAAEAAAATNAAGTNASAADAAAGTNTPPTGN